MQDNLNNKATSVVNMPMGSGKTTRLLTRLALACKEVVYLTLPNVNLANAIYESICADIQRQIIEGD